MIRSRAMDEPTPDLASTLKPAAPIPFALARFKQMPQRSMEVWQGMPLRMPAWVDNPDDPGGQPFRPWLILWVSLRTGLIHPGMPEQRGDWTGEVALKSLLDFGAKWGKQLEGRPGRVEVSDARLRDAIAPALASVNTPVVLVDDLPAVKEAFAMLEAQATDGRRLPGALAGAGVTIDRLRAFADAAAAFYRARPWMHLTNEDLIVVESPKAPRGLALISVLGNGGQEFGLSFFESRRAFDDMMRGTLPAKGLNGVTFGPIAELPFADADTWEDYALPVAAPRAYPLASRMTLDGRMTRPQAAELAFIEALLRALAETTEDELDAGRWTRRVETIDGAVDLTLALPDLLAAIAPAASAASKRTRAARRGPGTGAEQVLQRLQRFLNEREFASPDEANAAMEDARAAGLFDPGAAARADAPAAPSSAAERAQELAYEAMDASGRLRLKLAREALAISEDCTDAWVVLAGASSDVDVAVAHYERALDAAARTLGPEAFTERAGEFWGHLETRPYMRARFGLADILTSVGRMDEAAGHLQEMLRLNPGDNQGVRYLLLPLLFRLGRDADADALLRAYEGDSQATWPYGRALFLFRREGDSAAARQALVDAIAVNPHVARFLIDPDDMPMMREDYFTFGSEEEAIGVADSMQPAFNATPGALDWLARYARASTRARGGKKDRGRGGRPRAKRRKR